MRSSQTESGWISRRILIYFFVVFLFVLLVFGLFFLHRNTVLPIKTVAVQGELSAAAQKKVQELVKPFLASSGFFGLDLGAIQAVLEKIPGIATVQVRRIWPNTLSISLSNQSVVALWNDKYFINSYGEILPSNNYCSPQNLSKLYGADNSQVDVMDYYQQFSQLLQPLNLSIVELHFTPEKMWWLKLNNGLKIQLGDSEVLARMQKFVVAYPKLISNEKHPPTAVDLRYKHGMAVTF